MTVSKIEHLNDALRTIRKINRLLTRAEGLSHLLHTICRELIESRTYDKAWIVLLDASGEPEAYAQEGMGKAFEAAVASGRLKEAVPCIANALDQEEMVWVENPAVACGACPLPKAHGGWGAATVRLMHDNVLYGLLCISIPRELVSDDVERALINEIAGDIAFGIHRLKREEAHKRADAALEKRVNELNYFFSFSNLVEKPQIGLEEILAGGVNLLPDAMQYPDIAWSRIELADFTYQTDNYHRTQWVLSRDIRVHGKAAGLLEVGYLEERPADAIGPFQKEEQQLLHAAALRMGKIIERKRDRKALKDSEQLLRIQDKMTSLGRVAAGIAHEIRNPLSGINIYLRTLNTLCEGSDHAEEAAGILSQLRRASNKIEAVIKRVMDFSRPGEPAFVVTEINLPVREAVDLSSLTLKKKGIQIEAELGPNLPPCRSDPQMIEQVILNLITNASEAMAAINTEKKIRITTQLKGEFIAITVSDSGPGVSEKNMGNIFDPFYTTKSNSSGIGLSICHRIITDHGGSLEVGTSEWGGAAFMVSIPVRRHHPEQ